MKPPKALLIDLDDTLICYDGRTAGPWTEACETAGVRAAEAEQLVEEIIRYSGWFWSDPSRHREGRNRLEETRKLFVRKALENFEFPDNRLADEIGDNYSAIREERLHLFSGTREALETLKRRDMPMCLVTNGESHLQRRKIERFLLEPYFSGILIEGELGYGKPDERVFRYALEILGTPADDAWIIGDNFEWEVAAPAKLGLSCVLVDSKGNGPPAEAAVRPDGVISVFSEIIDMIAAAEAGA